MSGGIEPGKHRQKFADAFVERADERHGGNLDFSQVEYVDTATPVIVRCRRHNETFLKKPTQILAGGTGCKQCKATKPYGRGIKTVEDFVAAARRVHGDRYTYDQVCMWRNMGKDRVTIVCPDHGPFQQIVVLHLDGRGCKHCTLSAGTRRYTKETWVRSAENVHGQWYDYSKVLYVDGHTHVTIICPEHGEFQQTPACHLKGHSGCEECKFLIHTLSNSEFIKKATEVHAGKYTYEKTEYSTSYEDVLITCPHHGDFYQCAKTHLEGRGCSNCFKRFSKKSGMWLDFMAVAFATGIRHGDSGGEFVFPERRRWKCDGYIEETKTVFEFHGSYWHGDPSIYPQDTLHPHDRRGRTYGDMYRATKERETQIRAWGYTLVTMWESDWDRAVRAVVVIQKAWRERKRSMCTASYRLTDVWAFL